MLLKMKAVVSLGKGCSSEAWEAHNCEVSHSLQLNVVWNIFYGENSSENNEQMCTKVMGCLDLGPCEVLTCSNVFLRTTAVFITNA